MAEVYRARDTRLGREIALKVVNESLASSPELVRRFEQEARLAGSLNHPNVVAVYDVGLHEGAPYFVTELLQGESLRHRLSRGRIPLQTALDWTSQIAQGLAAAHAHGVIHRDVKPDNVFISSDGHVKLLDFGIAKLAEAAREGGPHGLMDVTVTPTGGATRTGSVLGTPGYMSPEQVGGESLDARTDIFSLGAVVYEMLSGKRAFPGATVVESAYAILHDEPEPLPAEVPPGVAQLVLHCLEKEPARRLQSASDLAFALGMLRSPTGSTGPVLQPSRVLPRRAVWFTGAAAVAFAILLVGLAVGLVVGRRRPPAAQPFPHIEQVTFRLGTFGGARFLPDGRVAFSAAFENRPEEVFVQPPGSISAHALGLPDVRLLGASRIGDLGILLHPRSSVHYSLRGTLARVPSVGGVPRELLEDTEYADWSPAGELAAVRVSGASRTLESPPGKVLFRTNGWISHPRFSFRGERIAFLHHPVFGDDMGEVVVADLQGQTRTLSRRWPTTSGVAWSPDDSEVWFAGGPGPRNVLAAVSLEGRAREIYRSLSAIRLEDVSRDGQVLLTNQVERSELVYAADRASSQILLSWSDWNFVAALSSDGKVLFSVAVAAPTGETLNPAFAMLRTTDGAPSQMLGEGYALDLSPDGRWALVVSTDQTRLTALPTGAGQPRPIATHGLEISWVRWMPDGKGLLVVGRTPPESDFRLYRLAGDGSKPVRVTGAPLGAVITGSEGPHVSQDGRWAAALDSNGRPIIVSLRDGAILPIPSVFAETSPRGWAPDGSLWLSEGGDRAPARVRLLRVDIHTGKVLEERSIGPTDLRGATSISSLALTPDGRNVAFSYSYSVGYLHIVRDLWRPPN
jgi:Tol biopolymer transport system component